MRKLFGTDGIRGVANVHPMTMEIAMQVGRAIAFLVKKENYRHRIVIGKDTRLSGYMIENAIVAGICSMGVDVLLVGPLPTPGIAFITTSMRADAGVVISASHNPFQDNGIKIFFSDGFKLPDAMELKIEDLVLSQRMLALQPLAEEVGRASRIDDAKGRYIVFLKNTFPKKYTLDGFHIVIDCAHGATYGVAPHVFEELGAKVTALGIEPNGQNINAGCGALHPELMAGKVKELGADIGLAFDGDGDRLIVCDEHGVVVDGDHVMAICAKELLAQRKSKKKTLVATVMSNMGLEVAMKKMGGHLVRADVGDRYVVECMRKNGYSFGGEQSGHLVFLEHMTTGDGILAALQILAIMKKRKKTLSELAQVMQSFPQVLKNVRTAKKISVDSIVGFADAVKKYEMQLGDTGRILVRPSGTEPVIRVMVEGLDSAEINDIADELCELIRRVSNS
ncbi:phosphoglucosamine mutase [Desulfotalea psychrophila]|uniref:Phosphoglucosamine mutase n=1 Tax=Desulfotalea psychrophila (strain LSv54 / DSM 12343) TaxID=177439 RepID=GLMM_DESPS|nr:phosphoglucosamine mutase [Desulfotalea psychrophila]Q6AMQ5.1 RecName: Full=Phosphoglucosamine mutase [Desulfotalea psychrophila LSv54]CAG36370.1 probable phosphoglucomutase/phosphomannomutase [Desulfotalea psychrophila LSv54]